MNSQPPANSTGPITKPTVTQPSNIPSDQGTFIQLQCNYNFIRKLCITINTKSTCKIQSESILKNIIHPELICYFIHRLNITLLGCIQYSNVLVICDL